MKLEHKKENFKDTTLGITFKITSCDIYLDLVIKIILFLLYKFYLVNQLKNLII